MAVFARFKIRHKVALTLIVIYTVTVVFVWVSLQQIKKSLTENRKAEMVTATAYTSSLVSSLYHASIENYLRGISETQLSSTAYYYDQFQKGLLTESEAKTAVSDLLLSQTIGSSGHNTVVDVSQGHNAITLAIHPSSEGMDISGLAFAQQMYEQRTGYMEFMWPDTTDAAPAAKSHYMSYFEPWQWIINADPFKKELYQLLDTTDLQHHLRDAQTKKIDSSYMAVFDSKGFTVYHPILSGENILGMRDTSTGAPFLKNLIAQATNQEAPIHNDWFEFSYTRDGEVVGSASDKLLYYEYLPEFDWFVAAIINKDDLQISYDILFNRLKLLGLLALLFVGFLAVQTSNYISRRLSHLTFAANKFAKNEYDFSLTRSQHDEIGDLEDVFADAATKITELLKTQTDLNVSLESTVLERTLELEKKNQELERLYVIDPLTGLFNRHRIDEVFLDEAKRAKRYQSTLGLIMFDIDHFKQINDQCGHLNGDKALIAISNTVKGQSRETDICGRWGGEEFVVICPNTDLAGLAKVAEKLREAIENTVIPDVGQVTASFGLSELGPNFDIERLVQNADEAMYAAKKQGRNRVVAMENDHG